MYGIREKKGAIEEDARGTFWIGKAIDMESRLRVACAIGKMEEEIGSRADETSKNAMHRTKVHQQCQVMEKVHIRKQW